MAPSPSLFVLHAVRRLPALAAVATPRARFHVAATRALWAPNDGSNNGVDATNQQAAPDAQLQEKVKDLEDKYVRALAEMENVRARGRRDVDSAKQFGIQGFAKDLLNVADVLRIAIENMPKELREGATDQTTSPLRQFAVGIEMTEKELLKVFEKHGLKMVDPMDKPFDPNYHNALFEVDDPSKPAGTVAFVQKKGFLLHDRSLRAADVGVVKRRD